MVRTSAIETETGARFETVRSAASACLVLALAACWAGGGAGPPLRAPGVAGESYFPMVAGTRWVYEVRAFMHTSRLEVAARGIEDVRGAPAPLFLVEERSQGGPAGFDDDGFAGYFVADGYVQRLSFLSEDPDGSVRLVGSEPNRVLPVAPTAGQRWEERSHVFTTPESVGGAQLWRAEVDDVPAVRVPAGRFDDVVMVRSAYLDPTVSDEPLVTYEDVYARGVGLVRSVSRNHQAPFFADQVEQRLVEVVFP